MDETTKDTEEPTVDRILNDWVDTEDLQNVMDYEAIDLFSIACIRLAAEGDADDYQYAIAVEQVYIRMRRNYQAELKDAETNVALKSDQSWINYMMYDGKAIKVLKGWLDAWSIEAFGTPYTESDSDYEPKAR